jgi:hypothetical protein
LKSRRKYELPGRLGVFKIIKRAIKVLLVVMQFLKALASYVSFSLAPSDTIRQPLKTKKKLEN